jgi:hypothetical protein
MAFNSQTDPSDFSDECPACGSEKREFIAPSRGDIHEPPCSGGEYCFDCGHEFEEDDEATRLGI